MKINEATNVQMPLKTVISLIVLVAAFTMGYFQITEKLNRLQTANQLMEADLLKKAEQTPKNLEIFMLIEMNAKILEKHTSLCHDELVLEKHPEVIEYIKKRKLTKREIIFFKIGYSPIKNDFY